MICFRCTAHQRLESVEDFLWHGLVQSFVRRYIDDDSWTGDLTTEEWVLASTLAFITKVHPVEVCRRAAAAARVPKGSGGFLINVEEYENGLVPLKTLDDHELVDA